MSEPDPKTDADDVADTPAPADPSPDDDDDDVGFPNPGGPNN